MTTEVIKIISISNEFLLLIIICKILLPKTGTSDNEQVKLHETNALIYFNHFFYSYVDPKILQKIAIAIINFHHSTQQIYLKVNLWAEPDKNIEVTIYISRINFLYFTTTVHKLGLS